MDKEEYELEHFGFSPTQISLERRHFLKKIVGNVIDGILSKLTSSCQVGELLAQQKEATLGNFLGAFEEHLQLVDALDKKYFSVPDHVLLPPHFDHNKHYSQEDEIRLDEKLQTLMGSFVENSVMLAMLKMESDQYSSVETLLEEELKIQTLLQERLNDVDLKELRELVDNVQSLPHP